MQTPQPITADPVRDAILEDILAEHYDSTAWIIDHQQEGPHAVRQSARETAAKLADYLPMPNEPGVGPFIARHHALCAALRKDQEMHGCYEDYDGWDTTRQLLRRIHRVATVHVLVNQLTAAAD